MTDATDRILGDLQKLVAELEGVLKASTGKPGVELSDAAEQLQNQFAALRTRLEHLQGDIEHGVRRAAKAADDSVRANPWGSVAIAAAGAFLLGLALARREPHTAHEPHEEP